MAAVQQLIGLIYHEKQQPGEMLCAQHALNSLLQGQYFSAPDLSEIARELDEDEQSALDDTERAATSNNMDDTGFFSVQVLQKALSDNFKLSLVQWGAQELRPYHDHPHTQLAFILNHAQHWYTLRRFGNVAPDPAPEADPGGGHWFNLNSFNAAPERIGKLYLGMFLQQAQQEGYSIFAVVQQDPSAKLALPRVEADEGFAYIPEDAAGDFSATYAPAAHGHGIDGLEDEDMELQAALQASLSGGDYGDYMPHRFAVPARASSSSSSAPAPIPAHAPFRAPQQLPSRTTSGVPIQREYEVIEDSDDDDPRPLPLHAEPIPVEDDEEIQELDPVAASMARQRAVMEHMRRAQELALQEQYEDEVARMNTRPRAQGPPRAGAGAQDEDEDEMLRRAIAESEAMAQGSRPMNEDENEDADRPHPAPLGAAPQAPPVWRQHRMYDDEDEELQAALQASLETVPVGFRVPSPQPGAAQSNVRQNSQSAPPVQPAPVVPPTLRREPSADTETESEADVAEPEVQLSMEEIRRRRLARFGG